MGRMKGVEQLLYSVAAAVQMRRLRAANHWLTKINDYLIEEDWFEEISTLFQAAKDNNDGVSFT